MTMRATGRLVPPAAIAVGVFATLVLVVVGGGFDLGAALSAFWRGSVGSPYALLSATLVRATPLILVGLAVASAFRAGVLNIGAEGQLLAGATAAVAVGLAGPTWPGAILLPAELLAGIAAGAAWAGVAAFLKRSFGVLEVISTLMLNFIAVQGVSYLVRGPLQEPTHVYPQTSALAPVARLPMLIPGHRVHLGLLVALALALVLRWVSGATAAGFRVRLVGASPSAAVMGGQVKVKRVVFRVFLASGAMAGLGGATVTTGQTYALFEDVSSGLGYTAIAVALLARLDPLAVIGTGIFFGALEAGAAAMQRDAGVPSVFVAILEALVVLGVLAMGFSRRASAVASTGIE